MARDPYAWIDPFEEAERADRAERYAAASYERGKETVLRYIAEDHKGDFHKALNHAVGYVAQKLAEETIKPHVARHFHEYEARQRQMELRVEAFNLIAQPLVMHTGATGELVLDVPRLAETPHAEMIVSYHVTQPFRYNVVLSPTAWR